MSFLGEAGPIKCAIGLMSGTSLDGIDAAIIYTDGVTVDRRGPSITIAYDSDTRKKIKEAFAIANRSPDPSNPPAEIKLMEQEITDLHIEAVAELLSVHDLSADDIDVIGFHGQTVCHRPDKGWTWQIGDGGRMAGRIGVSVVNDFRSADVASGGEGAPLVPLYHASLLQSQKKYKTAAILNLGGVGNVTWVHVGDDKTEIMAFDTGPGNGLMDDWAQIHLGEPYDKDGALAGQGVTHEEILLGLMASPYFDEVPPKSLDKDDFSIQAVRGLSAEDGAATLSDFTVESAVAAQSHFPHPPEAWFICGGGSHNKTLMRRLRRRFPVLVDPVEVLGWRGDALEAEAFAFLAVRSLRGLPLSLPSTTGTSEPMLGGVLNKPKGKRLKF